MRKGPEDTMSNAALTDHVRIHINREPHDSPNPILGEALYVLGQIPERWALFREVEGDHEDELIERHTLDVVLKQDEHFYSAKGVEVIVNGKRKVVYTPKLTFDQVVLLAFNPPPHGDGVQITVQYTRGPEHKPTGTLIEGQSVKTHDGMEFDVTATNRS
jgi:hypothetical protein